MRKWIRKWLGIVDAAPPPAKTSGVYSLGAMEKLPLDAATIRDLAFPIKYPTIVGEPGKAMDSMVIKPGYNIDRTGGMPREVISWFLNQSFIGYHMCAILSQQWLVNRACKIPAEDAVRNGWSGVDDFKELDEKWNMKKQCSEFARFNRVFGLRIAIMVVDGIDYELPFNIDGVKPGSYKGISQVDPNWCTPEFDSVSLNNPAAMGFYEPTWWTICGKRYHKSHLVVIRYAEVPDLLKPTYNFGGLSLPQLIWERVYAAERSANEGPQLLLTKRMNVLKTDLDEAVRDPENFRRQNELVSEMRDNYGQMSLGKDDEYQQHETSLGDFDAVVMTEYQLVAGIAEMPSTKLLGTSPKGFNATGEFETGAYRETLASIQEHHCQPLLTAHYLRAAKSLGKEVPEVAWNPMDEPTELDAANTRLATAQEAEIWQGLGVVSQAQNQKRLMELNYGYDAEELEEEAEANVDATYPGGKVQQPADEPSQQDGQADKPGPDASRHRASAGNLSGDVPGVDDNAATE